MAVERRPRCIGSTHIAGHTRAFLQVQNGCDHRCTFCIIPFGRGNSRSVPLAEVVAQARRLVENGHREIVLTGVDITSYAPGLGLLVKRILREVPELKRLRLSSIDSVEADADLLDALATDARLMPHLHLSLQAGDDLILKRMKRRHSRADAIAFCEQVRRLRPDVAFGGDIIAGFPTETEAMFARSLDLVDECGLTQLHVFPFSPRPGTPAARMPQVAARRHQGPRPAAARKGRGGAAPPSRRRGRRAPAACWPSAAASARTPQFTPVRLAAPVEPGHHPRCRRGRPRRATIAGGVIKSRRGRESWRPTASTPSPTWPSLRRSFPRRSIRRPGSRRPTRITNAYRALIEASPFCVMATSGPGGLDTSPRGDPKGFVRVVDENTIILPDRRGNNRIDSLRNLVTDPRVALIFLIPGVSETHPRHGPRHHLDRSGAVRELRHAGQGAALRAGDRGRAGVLPVRQGDRALQAVGPGDPGRARDACRPPARSWPRSAAARSAATSTTVWRRRG